MPKEPAADEWVEWNPPRPGKAEGEARLSEKAVNFVLDLFAWGTTVQSLRNVEHKCLDEHEAKGLIRQ